MIKHAFVAFLQANAGVQATVGNRVFPRRLDNRPTLPALVIHEINTEIIRAHSGDTTLRQSHIQADLSAISCSASTAWIGSIARV